MFKVDIKQKESITITSISPSVGTWVSCFRELERVIGIMYYDVIQYVFSMSVSV